jgi:hypothetical protein
MCSKTSSARNVKPKGIEVVANLIGRGGRLAAERARIGSLAHPCNLLIDFRGVIRACNAAVRQNRIPLGLPVLSLKPKW